MIRVAAVREVPVKIDIVFDRRTLREGEVLIREGDLGDVAFFIQSGLFEVSKRDRDRSVILTHLGKNAIVGEMALIDNHRRSATVRCVKAGTVVTLDRVKFEERMSNLDKFTRALLEMFSSKLRILNEEFLNAVRSRTDAADVITVDGSKTGLARLMDAWSDASEEDRRMFWQTVSMISGESGTATSERPTP